MASIRSRIYLYVFFLALAEALLFSINSTYITTVVSRELVGLVYSIASIGALILLSLLPFFIRKAGAGSILTTLLFAASISSFIVALGPIAFSIGSIVIFLTIPQVAPAVSDIFIQSTSKVKERGKVIGTEFTFINMAFLIAPIIGGLVIAKSGFGILYAISGALFILAIILSLNITNSVKAERTHTGHFWKGISRAWHNTSIRYILVCQFLLQFFFSWMVIYTPIYLINRFSFSYQTIGIIFTIMLLPYVLLEYPLGKLADSKVGEKELLTFGFTLGAITTSVIPLINSSTIWIWAVILVGTRIGAAMIESMSATYFFKKVDKSDIDLLALFRDMRPLAYIIGPILASIVLINLGIEYLFPILGVLLGLGALTATRIKDTK